MDVTEARRQLGILRRRTSATLVLLVVQFLFGVSVNLYVTIPTHHPGAGERLITCERRGEHTPEQMTRMQSRVRAGIEAGALGFSTGLCYQPGLYAQEDEVVALVRVAAEEHAIYATHMRNESAEEQAALDEAVRTAQRAGIPRLHIRTSKRQANRSGEPPAPGWMRPA